MQFEDIITFTVQMVLITIVMALPILGLGYGVKKRRLIPLKTLLLNLMAGYLMLLFYMVPCSYIPQVKPILENIVSASSIGMTIFSCLVVLPCFFIMVFYTSNAIGYFAVKELRKFIPLIILLTLYFYYFILMRKIIFFE